MKHRTLVCTLPALLLFSAAASAQKIAPGLWEYGIAMKSQSGRTEAAMAQLQDKLAAMPPEQRKQVEAMMASRGVGMGTGTGTGMGMAAGKPTTLRVCISPEQAAREEMPQHDGRCKQTGKERSGNTLRFKFSCTGEPPSSGEGSFTFSSDKEMQGRIAVDTVAQGQTEHLEMQQSGHWLAADCGDVKPRK